MSEQENIINNLSQTWKVPSKLSPIVIIGAGGIVNDAHLPAYEKAGFKVRGIYDIDKSKAQELAKKFNIDLVYDSLGDAIKDNDCIFDLALPPANLLEVVSQLPRNSFTILQKPLGRTLEEGRQIKKICDEKNITASMNFQLRFSPTMLPLYEAIDKGLLGELVELEVHVNVHTPWELWPFLKTLDRVEVPLHSIHYIDWIRSVLGNPKGVYCQSVKHPKVTELADCRTSAIFNYGEQIRCCMSINHSHSFGKKHQNGTIRLEGTQGAAIVTLGLLMNYPEGEPEKLEIITNDTDWTSVEIHGKWFPDAFIGVMSNMQRFKNGEDENLISPISDSIDTMSLVDACGLSSLDGGIKPDYTK
ncbi:Gfo/Idh/MocA family oxidoreductase, partial [Alphaproteobacteria bacterium]|nr:Gfo/Idh/MocA family oxidoreductase [Alphaproteobacteria bacterium]